jgi:hypothetical protein
MELIYFLRKGDYHEKDELVFDRFGNVSCNVLP